MTPSYVGKYRIVELIGQGSMGEVYLAEDPHIGRPVALKLMKTSGEEDAQRFLHEARIAGSLSHPNIVVIHEFGFQDATPYIVMEHVRGVSLEAWLRQPRAFAEHLKVIEGLYEALSYAHQRGVLHRDLKPSNVQVTPEGRCKLMDFGIARLQESRLTATGKVMGTPAYMAPEILEDASYSPQADIYASGVLVYEMLAGVNPFSAQTVAATLNNVLSLRPEPLSSLRPDIPRELCDAVARCMARDPRRRPRELGTLVSLVNQLRTAIGPRTTQPAIPAAQVTRSLLDVPSARLRRRRRRVRGAAAAAGALGVVGVVLLAVRPPERDAAEPAASATVAAGLPSAPPALAPASAAGASASSAAAPSEPPATPRPVRRRASAPPASAPPAPVTPAPAQPLPAAPTPAPAVTRAAAADPAAAESAPAATPKAPAREPPAAPPAALLRTIEPRAARRGATQTFELHGSGFRAEHRGRALRGRQQAHGIRVVRQQILGPEHARITVLVDEDAPIGLFSLALVDAEGRASNSVSFEVIL
jgi:serine/threonine-protein kinase